MRTRRWIITVLGKDRPGIVAGVTQALYRLGCNLEDSAMTRLEGEFAIMLIFSGPSRLTPQRLQRAFAPLERRLSLAVSLKPLAPSEARSPAPRGRPYVISVYGADRPGIVYRVSSALAGLGINITDVSTQRAEKGARSLYLLVLEIELPKRISAESLKRRLKALAKPLGVFISLRSADADIL